MLDGSTRAEGGLLMPGSFGHPYPRFKTSAMLRSSLLGEDLLADDLFVANDNAALREGIALRRAGGALLRGHRPRAELPPELQGQVPAARSSAEADSADECRVLGQMKRRRGGFIRWLHFFFNRAYHKLQAH